jgi:hypothetical protein
MSLVPTVRPENSFQNEDYGYCNPSSGVNGLMTSFEQIRTNVVSNLSNVVRELWGPRSPIPHSLECACAMGKNPLKKASLMKHMSCLACRAIALIVDLRKFKPGSSWRIECGTDAGKSISILERRPNFLMLKQSKHLHKLQKFVTQNPDTRMCHSNLSASNYLKTDSFTNEVLVSWLVDSKLKMQGLPSGSRLLYAFYCRDTGYCVYTTPSIGKIEDLQTDKFVNETGRSPQAKAETWAPLKIETSKAILQQLVATLKYLKQFDFIHGNPTLDSLVFYEEPCAYKYEDVRVVSPLTIGLRMDGKSSISTAEGRVYGLDQGDRVALETTTLQLNPMTSYLGDPELDDRQTVVHSSNGRFVTTYKLDRHNIRLFRSLLRMGVPVFASSFELYSFFVVLMCHYPFYESVIRSEQLSAVWRSIWSPEDYERVNASIKEQHHKECDLEKVLVNKHLRCDALDVVWSVLLVS